MIYSCWQLGDQVNNIRGIVADGVGGGKHSAGRRPWAGNEIDIRADKHSSGAHTDSAPRNIDPCKLRNMSAGAHGCV